MADNLPAILSTDLTVNHIAVDIDLCSVYAYHRQHADITLLSSVN